MTRWSGADAPRGDAYDARWEQLASTGADVHGEASFVASLAPPPRSVLDAGCGTGRVAVELARRGVDVVGVDLDAGMLDRARAKAPELAWVEGDLATLDLGRTFDAVVLAGNVLIFVAPGTEAEVLRRLAGHLEPGGALVAGFQLKAGRYDLVRFDADAAAAGLTLAERYATWHRDPWVASPAADYAVSVHRAGGRPPP